MWQHLSRPGFLLAAAALAGCGGAANPPAPTLSTLARTLQTTQVSIKTPALITFDTQSDGLAYFPIVHGGGYTMYPISGSLGVSNVYELAADGKTIVLANYRPAQIVTYDLATKSETTLSDPYGGPVDVAVGKYGTIYALNLANVAVYKSGSSPSELTCSSITNGVSIAVDNEGDVFVDGYGHSFQGVVEYPGGTGTCITPHLRASQGYVAGVGIDPKTDDLIVVDDPDLCAGGLEGRMIVYPKPYRARTSHEHVLQATYCAGTFRLDERSKHIFYGDATVSAGAFLIDQARYPSGKYEGRYGGYFSSNFFAGFTTLPNRLPN